MATFGSGMPDGTVIARSHRWCVAGHREHLDSEGRCVARDRDRSCPHWRDVAAVVASGGWHHASPFGRHLCAVCVQFGYRDAPWGAGVCELLHVGLSGQYHGCEGTHFVGSDRLSELQHRRSAVRHLLPGYRPGHCVGEPDYRPRSRFDGGVAVQQRRCLRIHSVGYGAVHAIELCAGDAPGVGYELGG